jgi:hypothetical protein
VGKVAVMAGTVTYHPASPSGAGGLTESVTTGAVSSAGASIVNALVAVPDSALVLTPSEYSPCVVFRMPKASVNTRLTLPLGGTTNPSGISMVTPFPETNGGLDRGCPPMVTLDAEGLSGSTVPYGKST